LSTILFLLVISILVFIHELGHFLVARYFGVKVYQFSIGFGKTLISKEYKGTIWKISLIPLGGYVNMKGQDDTKPILVNNDIDSYTSKTPLQRIAILLAGPLFNFFFAFFLYYISGIIGVNEISPKIGQVIKDTPAYKVGLKKDDIILSIDGEKVRLWNDLKTMISSSKQSINIEIKRGNIIKHFTLIPSLRDTKNMFKENIKRRMIGIAPKEVIKVRYNIITSFGYAFNKTIDASKMIFKGIQKLIQGVVPSDQIGGILSIGKAVSDASEFGIVSLFLMSALISVNLGVLNLLPIPALDGGHIMFNLYEFITRNKPSEQVFLALTIVGWVFLIFLMVFGLYNDINRLWGN